MQLAGEGDASPHDLVWLQAEVTNVSNDRDVIQFTDDGGKSGVLVSGCARAPGNAADLAKGDYCQVLGQVDPRHDDHVVVKAVKVVNLSCDNVDVLRAAWPDEVRELRKVRLLSS